MESQASRSLFIVFGFLFLLFSAIFISSSIWAGIFPAGHDVILVGMSVMAFCNAYLYPHFQAKDERSKVIREKGMFYSYFVLLAFLCLLMILFQLTPLQLDGYQTVSIITAALIMIVFISFVVVAKRI